MLGMQLIFMRHARTANQLKLMHFQRGQRKSRQLFGLSEHSLSFFTRQSDNDMSARAYAAGCCPVNRIDGTGKCMSPVDTLQGTVGCAFYSVFNQQKVCRFSSSSQLSKVSGIQSGRVPITSPTTSSTCKASVYMRFRVSSSPYVLV